MSRFWNSIGAVPINRFGVAGFIVLIVGGCALLGAAWHYFPAWIPRASWFSGLRRIRMPRGVFRRPRWRKPERTRRPATAPVLADPLEAEQMPDLPMVAFRSRADAFAADGRFAEAVRERLRAMIRGLVDARVIDLHPEWTVTELARAAAQAQPALDPALAGAGRVFSDIWYGERPAGAEHDQQMRAYEAGVAEILRSNRIGAVR